MTQTTPTTITTSGGLLTAAFIEAIRESGTRLRGLEPEAFAHGGDAPRTPAEVEAAIAAAWELLLERWDAVREELHSMDASQVRARWLLPLCQLLDFEPVYSRSDTLVDGDEKLRFPLSHRGWPVLSQGERPAPGAPVLQLITPTQSLDERAGSGQGFRAKSPHDMVQAFLNLSGGERRRCADTWALLSNGVFLRLLRTYHHTFTKGYVQFDLETIFETRNYADFRALYRMCHASRFSEKAGERESEKAGLSRELTEDERDGEKAAGECPLEAFYQDALATGVKVGENLRGQVRQAIETLGNGFLDGELLRLLTAENAATLTQQYYAEILHIIYRILFLLFAEQRGLLPHADAPLAELYRREYSITALRGRAEGVLPREDYGATPLVDLWEGLKVTFRMVSAGAPELGVFGYDGMLFAEGQTPLIGERALENGALLRAIRALTLIEREGALQRISYADLGVEELDSIYESLLDFTPHVTVTPEVIEGREIPAHTFILDPRGQERKKTGSYYTHPSLVQQLLETALLPVIRNLTGFENLPGLNAPQRASAEAALLSLKVCDPAAGSGHFLVKANNVLAAELARLRTGDEYSTEAALQIARRDVLAHCIYAVDLNPMAVELCKVSLWINASVRDAPLNFLDHHIRCGNSLVGMPLGETPFADNLPEGVFALNRAGDDPAIAKRVRERHRQERRDFEKAGAMQLGLFQVTQVFEPGGDARRWAELERLAENAPQAARERFDAYQADEKTARAKLIADTWAAVFFWPLTPEAPPPPTFNTFRDLLARGKEALSAEQQRMVAALAEKHRFFHWQLAFPDVFTSPSSPQTPSPSPQNREREKGERGGFDVVLGNPPWERIKLQEKEFFADKGAAGANAIAEARTAAERSKLIRDLPRKNPALHAAYTEALHAGEALGDFLRESGRYPLSAAGDLNTYQVFAGLVRQLVSGRGRVGVVLPTGIATDFFNQDYFSALVAEGALASLYDFENRQGLFPGVHRSYKFSLLTLTGPETPVKAADYAFFLHQVDELADPERHFALTAEDLRRINPNTGTCPIFRTRRDAELTAKLYHAAPVLVNGATGENPWGCTFMRMFDMRGDASLLHLETDIGSEWRKVSFEHYVCGEEQLAPMLEAKMIDSFDHRASSVGEETENSLRLSSSVETTLEQHQDPDYSPLVRYWVDPKYVQERIPEFWKFDWFIGFKAVTSPTNARTFVAAIIPRLPLPDRFPVIMSSSSNTAHICALFANLNSYVFDYVVRQKMGGITLNYFIVEQLPVLLPETYARSLTQYTGRITDFIVPRVLELTYTAWDLRPFADDVWAEADAGLQAALRQQWEENQRAVAASPARPLPPSPPYATGFPHPPFTWDEGRRAQLRAELDALYAHLYGLSREEVEYILETFPIVKRRDVERWGEYRTKRRVVEAWEALRG